MCTKKRELICVMCIHKNESVSSFLQEANSGQAKCKGWIEYTIKFNINKRQNIKKNKRKCLTK